MKKTAIGALIFLCSIHQLVQAKTLYTEPDQGRILFKATALGLRFEGVGQGAKGLVNLDQKVSGELEFQLSTLDTGIPLRDTHMKEKYLETAKFPISKIVITKVTHFDPSLNEQESDFEGLLTVRGMQKPIKDGKLKVSKKGDGYRVEATFTTKISDFEIPLPKYAGVAVRDDLQIVADLTFDPRM